MRFIRTFAVYIYLGLVVAFGVPYFNHIEKKKEALGGESAAMVKRYAYARTMAKRIVALTGSKITIKGQENIPEGQAVLFVGNHQSYMDIPLMMTSISRPIGFVAKDNLGKIPFFDKWLMYLKCVLIARGDARKALVAILEAAKILKGGHSLVLFPEGTRSADGTLGEFKAGSLKAAQKGNVGIVPVAIKGAREIMPRNSFWMYKSQVTVEFLPFLSAEEVKASETKALAKNVKNQIARAIGQPVEEEIEDGVE